MNHGHKVFSRTAFVWLGLCAASPAMADTFGALSTAEYLSGNASPASFVGIEVHVPGFSSSEFTHEIGFASSFAKASAGALAGRATISMDATEFVGASMKARSEASSVQSLHFGTDYCLGASCQSAASLGVTAVNADFSIHASGSPTAFATDTRFNQASASVSFNYRLTNGVGFSVSGVGATGRLETGEQSGSVGSVSGNIAVRPGETLELQMSMTLFAAAKINGWHNSGFTSAHVFADADFAHTLLWGGITNITAFGADGQVIDLAPGGRFQLVDDAGNDFWVASPGVAAVPEPASLVLMCAGLALGAFRQVRRRAAARQ